MLSQTSLTLFSHSHSPKHPPKYIALRDVLPTNFLKCSSSMGSIPPCRRPQHNTANKYGDVSTEKWKDKNRVPKSSKQIKIKKNCNKMPQREGQAKRNEINSNKNKVDLSNSLL